MKRGRQPVIRSLAIILASALALAAALTAAAEDHPAARLVRQTCSGAFGERDYYLYLPPGYAAETDRRWPLSMFLHGNGERGDAEGDPRRVYLEDLP